MKPYGVQWEGPKSNGKRHKIKVAAVLREKPRLCESNVERNGTRRPKCSIKMYNLFTRLKTLTEAGCILCSCGA